MTARLAVPGFGRRRADGHVEPCAPSGLAAFGVCAEAWLALRVPRKSFYSNHIGYFTTQQLCSQRNILEALEPA